MTTRVDRHLIGGLLGQQADMEIQFANDGAKALAMLPESMPDLIVTDLQMPFVDGLELVKSVKRDYSNLPVVLITSYGSEKTAIEALKHGAASYSPKSVLEKGPGSNGPPGSRTVTALGGFCRCQESAGSDQPGLRT